MSILVKWKVKIITEFILLLSLQYSRETTTDHKCSNFEYSTQGITKCVEDGANSDSTAQTRYGGSEQQYHAEVNGGLFEGNYTFNVTSIPRVGCHDPEAFQYLKREEPVLLTNCSLADTALQWSPEYFLQHIEDNNLTVHVSRTRRFLYYNEAINKVGRYNWSAPHQRKEMNFSTFMKLVSEIEEADNGTRAYLQSSLEKAGLSSDMQDDVFLFNYPWLRNISGRLGWSNQDTNLLLVGMRGVVTPAHYDIINNLFFQVYGKKRCILFRPEHFRSLYPYPVHHPHDRQSQVNFDSPDFTKFSRFREAEGLEAIVSPGEVLFIPSFWWHYIESETKNMTISITFWYETKESAMQQANDKESSGTDDYNQSEDGDTPNAQESQPNRHNTDTHTRVATAAEQIALRRDIEESVMEALGDASKVGQFIKEMFEDRFEHV